MNPQTLRLVSEMIAEMNLQTLRLVSEMIAEMIPDELPDIEDEEETEDFTFEGELNFD